MSYHIAHTRSLITGMRVQVFGNLTSREVPSDEQKWHENFLKRAGDMKPCVYKSDVYPFIITIENKLDVNILTRPTTWGMAGNIIVAEFGRDIHFAGSVTPQNTMLVKIFLGVHVRLVADLSDNNVLPDVQHVQIGLESCAVVRVNIKDYRPALLFVSDAQAKFIQRLPSRAIRLLKQAFYIHFGGTHYPVGVGFIGSFRDKTFDNPTIPFDHLAHCQFLAHPAFLCVSTDPLNAGNKLDLINLERDEPYSALCVHHARNILSDWENGETRYTEEDIIYWANEMANRFGRLWVPKSDLSVFLAPS